MDLVTGGLAASIAGATLLLARLNIRRFSRTRVAQQMETPAIVQVLERPDVVEVVHRGVALLGVERIGEKTLLTLLYCARESRRGFRWEGTSSPLTTSGAGVLEWALPGQWPASALMSAAGDSTSGTLQVRTHANGDTFSELRLARLHIKCAR